MDGPIARCHPERSEGSLISHTEILRCAQNDNMKARLALYGFSHYGRDQQDAPPPFIILPRPYWTVKLRVGGVESS